jgi:hypothetical protein
MALSPAIRSTLFNALKSALEQCAPPMVVSKDKKDVYELMGDKPVPYGSKKTIVPGMYFSSIVARKDMVSFYFFPLYYQEKNFEKTIPTLMKYLKGKTCFHFKKPDQLNTKEMAAMLKKGIQAWKKNGYMK